jgi:hypothetical protein
VRRGDPLRLSRSVPTWLRATANAMGRLLLAPPLQSAEPRSWADPGEPFVQGIGSWLPPGSHAKTRSGNGAALRGESLKPQQGGSAQEGHAAIP